MLADELSWQAGEGWRATGGDCGGEADLVLYFGARAALDDGARHGELRVAYPRAHILGCSTGGQIRGQGLEDSGIAAVALRFSATRLQLATGTIRDADQSFECGAGIGAALTAPDLAGVFLLSDGLNVNGSRLLEGIVSTVGHAVPITGGLAGDGPDFCRTVVGADDAAPKERLVAAVGFYGTAIRFGHGCRGGWDAFGPRRRITASKGNVLHCLDDRSALALYERYLGEEAEGLPGTALLYPLRVWNPAQPEHDMVRTVLGIDRASGSMTFAGDVPQGWDCQLMRGRFESLTAAAAAAATSGASAMPQDGESLAILVSCIGRRILMGQNISDEIEAASDMLGSRTHRIGFYSYGEIGPIHTSGRSGLHNQTMAVTTLSEVMPG